MVLDHIRDVQIFDDDGAVLVHIPPRHLVQKILALSGRLEVQLRYRPRRFPATIRALPAAAHLALSAPKLLLRVLVAASTGYRVAVGVSKEDPEPDVEADRWAVFGWRRLSKVTNNQRVPITVSPENEVHGFRRTFERAMLLHFDSLAELTGDAKPAVLEPNVPTLPVLAEVYRMPAISRFEARESRLLSEFFAGDAAPQGFVQPVSKRLYRSRGDMLVAAALKPGCERILEKKLAGFGIMISNLLKHLVVQMARLSETSHQQPSLAAVRVESVLERLEHCASCTVSAAMIHPPNKCVRCWFSVGTT